MGQPKFNFEQLLKHILRVHVFPSLGGKFNSVGAGLDHSDSQPFTCWVATELYQEHKLLAVSSAIQVVCITGCLTLQ